MAQVSYGTITITDTNDIERIYVEYCRSTSNQLSGTTVPDITRAWGETTPEWVDGQYIWQRTVVEESGTQRKTYGTPVCISGEKGETGEQGPQGIQGGTGAAGRSLKSTTTHYTTAAATATITQSNMGSYTWSSDVPTYNASTPAYWVRVTNVYENPSSTVYIFYKDNGITDAVKTSHDANSTAASANSTANAANQTANSANTTANNANTKADQAVTNVNNLQAKLKYYWVNEVNHTNGVSGWTKPNYPVGTYAASGISGTTFDSENSSTYGYNTWYANGINLRYNAINLGQLTGTSLTFYHPSTSSQGGKAMELTGSALKFYDSTGSVAQATFGGTQATISGTINVYDGKIGNGSNYWYIGNYTDYNQNDSAIIKSIGTASIQLNETNTWRIATNRIHTAWAPESGIDAYKLHFPIFMDSENNNKHWDFGLHLPTSNSDKFLYIRNAARTQSLDNLLNDLDDAGYNYWTYKFYIDSEGNLHAGDIYSHGTLISGTSAPYLLKSGGTITGDLTVNGTITGTLSGTASNANTVNNLTVQTAVPANAVFTDTKVTQTASTGNLAYELLFSSTADNTTRTEGARKTSTLTYNPSTKALLTGGTINGYTLAAASAKGVDTSLTASSTSANLPTSAAVANLIKQYLPLTGGNVTGAVSFGSSVSADELTVGDLVVNDAASFTNNLQANTINGVAVGSSPKFTDTVTTVTVTGNGNAVTSASASNGAVTLTKGATFLTSYTETDPIFKASAAYGISSTDISNWNSKTSNTGTVTKVTAGTGLKIGTATSGGDITTTGTINHINSVTAKTAAAQSAKTLTWGGTFTLYEEKYDAQGHVTGVASYDMTMPANPNTHNTAYLYAGKSDGTANAATTNGNTYLILMDGGSATTRRKISGGGTVSVASDASGNITITGSAHPTSLKNPNALAIKVYNGTATSSDINYDGSTANQSVSVAGTNAITGINSTTDGKLQLTLADGSKPTPISVKITATTSDSAASADKLNLSANVGSSTQPVYFDANTGLPKTIDYTIQSSVPQNAKFTDTWTAMVGATSSANGSVGYVNAVPPKDGYNTKFLRADGTWVVPGGTYSLPLAANGTRGGVQIGYTANGKNYPVQLSSEKMYVNVPWENTTYSAGTGLSLSGTMFNNTGVISIKGNSESTYRTGTVNLTAANIGAVALSGNETIAGNKNFTGITNITYKSTFGTSNTTAYSSLSNGIIYAPMSKYLWHDLFAFGNHGYPTFYTSANNSTWTEATLDKRHFICLEYLSINIIAATGRTGVRWVWNNVNLSYSGGAWLVIGIAYSASQATINIVLESSTDGSTWTVRHNSSITISSQPIWCPVSDYANATYIRLTITKDASDTTKTCNINAIKLLTSRWGDQGGGSEYEYPYTWDVNKNVAFPAQITATQFNGNATSASAISTTGTTAQFWRGDNKWAQVSSADLSDIRLTWSSSVSTTDWILAHDTAVTGTPLFRAMSPANLKTTMSLNNVENTKLSTWVGSSNITTVGTISSGTWNGSAIPIANGGTGATTAANARTNLGLGSAATASTTTSIASGGTGLPTAGTVYTYVTNAISGASNTYVTIATDQTITASQKTFNGAIRWGTTSKYGAAHYDSTLDALVFSFA